MADKSFLRKSKFFMLEKFFRGRRGEGGYGISLHIIWLETLARLFHVKGGLRDGFIPPPFSKTSKGIATCAWPLIR